MKIQYRRRVPFALALLLLLATLATVNSVGRLQASPDATHYINPLNVVVGDQRVESCADPDIIRAQQPGDNNWYMYCTKDPLHDQDKTGSDFNFHNIPMFQSNDLVHWNYVGDAFASVPSLGEPDAGVWAPDIAFFNGQYYLYFVITDLTPSGGGDSDPNCDSDNGIAVATSSSPTGPWGNVSLVVPPRSNGGCNYFWTFDPEVVRDVDGQRYIFFGSYYGGIHARRLSTDGMSSDAGSDVRITIPNRYEAPEIIRRGGYWYLFASAANCCNGPLTGYSVFAGRSANLLGPYVDAQGVPLDPESVPVTTQPAGASPSPNGRVGGSVVLTLNGSQWVGPGHNSVFRDFDGQWWTVYHAVNRFDPYFEGALGFTKRPVLLDPVDWRNGWPTVRGGFWSSVLDMPSPAAQPGQHTSYVPVFAQNDEPGRKLAAFSDEFNGNTLDPKWTWVREPVSNTFGVENGSFRFDTQAADLYVNSNNASVLTENAPTGSYIVETKVRLNVPPGGCCYNYVQAGLVIYKNDDAFIKLVHASIWETRQTEFAKEIEMAPNPENPNTRYGNTVVGPPGEWTWLRIVKRVRQMRERYRAYTSFDGVHWERGGVWTHALGTGKIGLVSMGSSGFTANFDYVRVYRRQR